MSKSFSRSVRVFLLSFLLLFGFAFFSKSKAEKVSDFKSFIEVKQDGRITVREEIIIDFKQGEAKNKFTRNLLKIVKNRTLSEIIEVKYNVLGVRVNGVKKRFSVSDGREYMEISVFGEGLLTQGANFYEIEYDVFGAIASFNNFDEFDFYVTDESFSKIGKISAVVSVPKDISFVELGGYLSKNYRKGEGQSGIKQIIKDIAYFRYDRALSGGNIFVISLKLSKGVNIVPVTFAAYQDPIPLVRIMVIFIFVYYVILWFIYGRNEGTGKIIPNENPSLHLTSGKASAVYFGRNFNLGKSIAAEIFSLAKRGYILFHRDKKNKIWLKRTDKFANKIRNEEEQFLLKGLFEKSNELLLEKSVLNDKKMIMSLRDTFGRYRKILTIFRNRLIEHSPRVIFFGIFFHLAFAIYFSLEMTGWFLFLNVLSGLYILFFYVIFTRARMKEYLASSLFVLIISMHSFKICPKFFDYFSCDMANDANNAYHTFFILMGIILFMEVLHILFYHLMYRPNLAAMRILRELASVKDFILSSNNERLNKITAKIFENNLPYAVIFGLEDKWQKDFSLTTFFKSYKPVWSEGDFDSNICSSISGKIEDAVDFIFYSSTFNKIKKRKKYGRREK